MFAVVGSTCGKLIAVKTPSAVVAAVMVLANALKSATAAVPDPVKYGILFAALVSPAIAAKSPSYACTLVPITSPSVVRCAAASASSSRLRPTVVMAVRVARPEES